MNSIMNGIKTLFLALLFISQSSTAQQSAIYLNQNPEYHKAIQLYKEKQFQAAQILFERVKNAVESEEIISDLLQAVKIKIKEKEIEYNQIIR